MMHGLPGAVHCEPLQSNVLPPNGGVMAVGRSVPPQNDRFLAYRSHSPPNSILKPGKVGATRRDPFPLSHTAVPLLVGVGGSHLDPLPETYPVGSVWRPVVSGSACSPKSVTTSDSNHQSAPDQHPISMGGT